MTDQLPPNNPQLEKEVLGTLLDTPRKGVSEFLSMAPNVGSYFYDLRHQTLFKALVDMIDAGRKVTTVTLLQWLTEHQVGAAVKNGLNIAV